MEHRPTLFLLELVVDLALFTICAAVCVGLLLRARDMSRESRELTEAVYIAQSAAERTRCGLEGGGIYRADGTRWETPLPEAGAFPPADYAAVAAEKDGRFNISVYKGDRLVYSLEGVAGYEE